MLRPPFPNTIRRWLLFLLRPRFRDFFFDDFHHQGAYLLSYFFATPTFGYQKPAPTARRWYTTPQPQERDGYQFFLNLGPLSNAKKYYGEDNFFWQQLVEHPNYDSFWQKRSILPHLKNVKANVMTVGGGWFDAEDLYGPLNIYRELEKNNPKTFNVLVMGPWEHGGWSRGRGTTMAGNIAFGENLSLIYQRQVEAPFFRHFLKGTGEKPKFEAFVFDCGNKQMEGIRKMAAQKSTGCEILSRSEWPTWNETRRIVGCPLCQRSSGTCSVSKKVRYQDPIHAETLHDG